MCYWIGSVSTQQAVPPNASFPPQPHPQSASGHLPPPSSASQLPSGASFPPVVAAVPARGTVPPPSVGQIHQMPPVPGSGVQRPAGAMPPRPPVAQLPPTSANSVSHYRHTFLFGVFFTILMLIIFITKQQFIRCLSTDGVTRRAPNNVQSCLSLDVTILEIGNRWVLRWLLKILLNISVTKHV